MEKRREEKNRINGERKKPMAERCDIESDKTLGPLLRVDLDYSVKEPPKVGLSAHHAEAIGCLTHI